MNAAVVPWAASGAGGLWLWREWHEVVMFVVLVSRGSALEPNVVHKVPRREWFPWKLVGATGSCGNFPELVFIMSGRLGKAGVRSVGLTGTA